MSQQLWQVETEYKDNNSAVGKPRKVVIMQKPAMVLKYELMKRGNVVASTVAVPVFLFTMVSSWQVLPDGEKTLFFFLGIPWGVALFSIAAAVIIGIAMGLDEVRKGIAAKQSSAETIRWTFEVDGAAKLGCAKALLKRISHGSNTFDTLPKEVCEAFDRLVDVHDDKGLLDAAACDELCNHLYDLLNHDDSWEDVLVLLNTVASTDNPVTLETARTTLRELHEVWQTSRNNALERRKAEILEAKAAEQAQLREVAQAQPDYSAELVELAARRRAMMVEVA